MYRITAFCHSWGTVWIDYMRNYNSKATAKLQERLSWCSKAGMYKSRAPGQLGGEIFYGGSYYLWVFSMKPASCHPSGAKGFEKASIFLENLCTRPVWKSHMRLLSLSLHSRTASASVRVNCNQFLFRTLVSLVAALLLSASSVHCVLGAEVVYPRQGLVHRPETTPRRILKLWTVENTVFLDVTLCQLLDKYLRFGRNRRPHSPAMKMATAYLYETRRRS